jgi:hypothetical protein
VTAIARKPLIIKASPAAMELLALLSKLRRRKLAEAAERAS